MTGSPSIIVVVRLDRPVTDGGLPFFVGAINDICHHAALYPSKRFLVGARVKQTSRAEIHDPTGRLTSTNNVFADQIRHDDFGVLGIALYHLSRFGKVHRETRVGGILSSEAELRLFIVNERRRV